MSYWMYIVYHTCEIAGRPAGQAGPARPVRPAGRAGPGRAGPGRIFPGPARPARPAPGKIFENLPQNYEKNTKFSKFFQFLADS